MSECVCNLISLFLLLKNSINIHFTFIKVLGTFR